MFDIQSYQKAESVSDAIRLLGEDPEARLIAGGTDVLIKLREFEGFSRLVDIHDLPELKPITREADGTVRVGSGASFTDLEESPIIRECIPMLGESAASVAGPQIRNMGTIGGNLCNGAVSADTCAPVLALNGYLNIRGAEGERTIPALGFHTGPGRVALKRDEVLLSVEFRPEDWQGWGAAYHKYAMREAMDIATIGCAAAVRLDGTVISGIRLAYSVSAPIPVRCPSAEAAALGRDARSSARHPRRNQRRRGSGRAAQNLVARQPGFPYAHHPHAGGTRHCPVRRPRRRTSGGRLMLKTIRCTVNGKARELSFDVRASLLEVLRAEGLTSSKQGCGVGECGACTVLVDNIPVDSCIFLAVWADGKTIRTAEGEAKGNRLSRVQQAYVDAGAVQCGFCTPGLVMSSTAFIEKHKGQPVTREEIRRGHAGNLCRCTGYDAIIAAVESCLNDTPPQNTCACLRKPDGPCHHRQS